MWIQTEQTPNPESIKFLPGETVLSQTDEKPTKTLNFTNVRAALASPLAKNLFSIEGVKGVFYGPDFLTITKSQTSDWNTLKPQVFAAISEFYASGKPLLSEEEAHMNPAEQSTVIKPEDSETVAMIKEILETRVRPGLLDHSGDIEYKGFEDGVVYLKFQAACSGCSYSAVTVKNGIQKMLMHWVPEVMGVVAADDDELEKLNLKHLKNVEQQIESKTNNVSSD